ncbi:MAG TPA: hypothetical protein PK360_02470 [bacterium]|nr:hypothetical protein [bacterium]
MLAPFLLALDSGEMGSAWAAGFSTREQEEHESAPRLDVPGNRETRA